MTNHRSVNIPEPRDPGKIMLVDAIRPRSLAAMERSGLRLKPISPPKVYPSTRVDFSTGARKASSHPGLRAAGRCRVRRTRVSAHPSTPRAASIVDRTSAGTR